jgi:hypothetical protein
MRDIMPRPDQQSLELTGDTLVNMERQEMFSASRASMTAG